MRREVLYVGSYQLELAKGRRGSENLPSLRPCFSIPNDRKFSLKSFLSPLSRSSTTGSLTLPPTFYTHLTSTCYVGELNQDGGSETWHQ
jgi:hypothetical protein